MVVLYNELVVDVIYIVDCVVDVRLVDVLLFKLYAELTVYVEVEHEVVADAASIAFVLLNEVVPLVVVLP